MGAAINNVAIIGKWSANIMRLNNNTVLITGGATGIGKVTENFFLRDNTVIICGRREARLKQAAEELPGIHTFKCDVSNDGDCKALFKYVCDSFPDTNILINKAGIQRDIDLTKGISNIESGDNEIRINFEGPVFLSALFTPFLSDKDNAVIVNVSSGLAFMPDFASGTPVYCATKAAMHSFSVSQRIQLAPLGIRVVEVIPPMVESELNLESRKKRNMAASPMMMSADKFIAGVMLKMERDIDEISFRNS